MSFSIKKTRFTEAGHDKIKIALESGVSSGMRRGTRWAAIARSES
ncbi:hypothetical protein [Oxalobacter paraformigenes]|nr:hypothetical protein [Oxalobacter paraformigenes]